MLLHFTPQENNKRNTTYIRKEGNEINYINIGFSNVI